MKTFVKLVVESGAIVDGDRVPDVGEVVEINGDKAVRTSTERVVDAEASTTYVYLRGADPAEVAAHEAKVRRETMISDRARAEAARRQAEQEDRVKREAEQHRAAAEAGKRAIADLVASQHSVRRLPDLGTFRRTVCPCGAQLDTTREYGVVRTERTILCDRCSAEVAPDLHAMVEAYAKKRTKRAA